MAFSKRLVKKEHNLKAKYNAERVAQQGHIEEATKKSLEAAINHKVETKLEEGNMMLKAERKQLMSQFTGSHSLFGKAEQAELKGLRHRRHAKLEALDDGAKL